MTTKRLTILGVVLAAGWLAGCEEEGACLSGLDTNKQSCHDAPLSECEEEKGSEWYTASCLDLQCPGGWRRPGEMCQSLFDTDTGGDGT